MIDGIVRPQTIRVVIKDCAITGPHFAEAAFIRLIKNYGRVIQLLDFSPRLVCVAVIVRVTVIGASDASEPEPTCKGGNDADFCDDELFHASLPLFEQDIQDVQDVQDKEARGWPRGSPANRCLLSWPSC